MKAYVGDDRAKACRMTTMNRQPFHVASRLGAGLFACLALWLFGSNPGSAQEAVTVQEVLADPVLFHLRQITLKGTVRNVVDFGAFVDIGVKEDGLVHLSRMAKKFVKHPLDIVKVGDVIEVKVITIDRERHRIGLSMVLD